MKGRKPPSQGLQIALVALGLLAVAAAGYFLVLGPKRAAAADVARQIQDTQAQIDALRVSAAAPAAALPPPLDASELFRLSKAMPDRPDMAAVILELNRIAKDTGIEFDSIDPQAATPGSGYQVVPISLSFQGTFYNLSDFLFRLRNLVAVRDGQLTANGRLFNVQSVTFGAGEKSFPQLIASVTVNAFVFGEVDPEALQAAPPATEAPPPAGTETPPDPSSSTPPPTASAVPAVDGTS